jgi:hypothetical protein
LIQHLRINPNFWFILDLLKINLGVYFYLTMNYQITPEWRITLEMPYQRRIEDNALVLWTIGRTIVATAFRIPANITREELLDKLKSRQSTGILDVYETIQDDIDRLAFMQSEEVTEGQSRLAMHTFNASPTSLLQIAFYFDIPKDVEWARATWNSVNFDPTNKENKL